MIIKWPDSRIIVTRWVHAIITATKLASLVLLQPTLSTPLRYGKQANEGFCFGESAVEYFITRKITTKNRLDMTDFHVLLGR